MVSQLLKDVSSGFYVSPPPGRHIGLLWFAVSRRRRRRRRLRRRRRRRRRRRSRGHFADQIPRKVLGLGLSYYPILVTEGVQ